MEYIVLLGIILIYLNLSKLKNKFGKKIKICEDFGINGDFTVLNAFAYLATVKNKKYLFNNNFTGVKRSTIE